MNSFKGNKIYLRALEPADIDYIFSVENNENYWNVSDSQLPFSKFILKDYLNNTNKDIYEIKQVRLVISNFNDIPIGLIDLFDIDFKNKRACVGVIINDNEQNKGYASEALDLIIKYSANHLYLNQLYCNILNDNKISLKLFLNKKFKIVGIKKQWVYFNNQYYDEILLQRLICT